jgi:type II secretory pathway component GspD/PulD (secretin)
LVRVRNGETLVLGGLIDRSEEEAIQQVPILSGIPFLGEAFKNREVDRSVSELIVFVTPTILSEPAGSRVAAAGQAPPMAVQEQEESPSRQELMEETLNLLDNPG